MTDTNVDSRLEAIEARLEHFHNLLEGHIENQANPEEAAIGAFGELIKAHINSLSDSINWLTTAIESNVQPEQQDNVIEVLDSIIDSVQKGFENLTSQLLNIRGDAVPQNEDSIYKPLKSNAEQIEELSSQLSKQADALTDITSNVGTQLKALRLINLCASTEVEAQNQAKANEQGRPVSRPIADPVDLNSTAADLAAAKKRIADLEARVATAEKERDEALHELENGNADSGHWKNEYSKAAAAISDVEDTLGNQLEIGQERIRALFDEVQTLKGNIRVMCRIRPSDPSTSTDELVNFGPQEVGERGDHWGTMNLQAERKSLTGAIVSDTKTFSFERIFGAEATNGDIFAEVKDFVETAMFGKVACIFSYGQTGSGKTFTLSHKVAPGLDSSNNGIIHQSLARMFQIAAEEKGIFQYQYQVSIIEIHLDTIYDLLQEPDGDEKMGIRLDQAQYIDINSEAEAETLLEYATKIRATSSTNRNSDSSRSHLILTFKIRKEVITGAQSGTITEGKLHLIDLAGSERSASQNLSGQQLQEGIAINQSLTSLNRAITALGKGTQISYDTALIRALRPALSQGCRTLMLVMISPLKRDVTVSLQTLEKGAEATKARLAPATRASKLPTTPAAVRGKAATGLPTPPPTNSPIARRSTSGPGTARGRTIPRVSTATRGRGGKQVS